MFLELFLIEVGVILIVIGGAIIVGKIISKAIKEKKLDVYVTVNSTNAANSSGTIIEDDVDYRKLAHLAIQKNVPIKSNIQTNAQIFNEAP